jgi:hypothetical protein
MPRGVYIRTRMDPRIRFWAKVNKNGPIPANRPDLGSCWIWLGSKNHDGYGRFNLDRCKRPLAHVFAYEDVFGPVPEGLELDHLCRVHQCCNPHHVEPVTRRENLLRGNTVTAENAAKTHCPRGHPYDLVNTSWREPKRPGNAPPRACITCRRTAQREQYREKCHDRKEQ